MKVGGGEQTDQIARDTERNQAVTFAPLNKMLSHSQLSGQELTGIRRLISIATCNIFTQLTSPVLEQ